MERSRIARAAVILTLGNLVTSILGFVRQAVIAGQFRGHQTDAWFAAYTVPQTFYDLVIGGAVAAAMIPSFTRLASDDRDDFWCVVRSIFLLAGIVMVVVIAVLEVAAHPLMNLTAGGFLKHPGGQAKLNKSVQIVRIMLPTLFFWGMAAVALAALYSLGKRMAASFATACFHIGIIIAAVVLAAPFGIIALAIGAIVGAAAQFLVQVPSMTRAHLESSFSRARPWVDLRDPAVRKIILLYAPVALGLIVSVVGQFADLYFKSQLRNGGLSNMQYATTLIQFPVGIVVAALGLAVLPLISADAAAGHFEDLKSKLAFGFRIVLILMIPATIGYFVLGHQIIALLFEHGKFSAEQSARTATALYGYAPQLPFIGIDQLLIFAFYARHNTVTPMVAGVIGVAVYVTAVLITAAVGSISIFGLAVANTIQIGVHMLLLLAILIRVGGTFRSSRIAETAVKVLGASAGMAAAVLATSWALDTVTSHGSRVIAVVAPLTVAIAVYLGLVQLFRVEDARLLRVAIRSRVSGGQ